MGTLRYPINLTGMDQVYFWFRRFMTQSAEIDVELWRNFFVEKESNCSRKIEAWLFDVETKKGVYIYSRHCFKSSTLGRMFFSIVSTWSSSPWLNLPSSTRTFSRATSVWWVIQYFNTKIKTLASNGCNDVFRGLRLVQLALVKVLQLTGQIAVDFLWHYGWKWLLTRVGGRSMTYQATNVSGVIRYTFSISCVTEQKEKKRLRFVKVCWTWLDLISPGRESSNSPCSLNNRENVRNYYP